MKKLCTLTLFGVLTALAQTQFNPLPSRILGQAVLQQQQVTALGANLVEGREFNAPQSLAIDASGNPPILYVADSGNNRVLAWKNLQGFKNGDFADLVIGQPDKFSTRPSGPGSLFGTGLTAPTAVAVDAAGNLYVADAGNNRVVRYPKPFSQTGVLPIDMIIGQADGNGSRPNAGQSAPTAKSLSLLNGSRPLRSGLAFDAAGNLYVSDAGNNRVLRFPAATLASGAANDPVADLVLGHADFVTAAAPSGVDFTKKTFLATPSGIAFDPGGRLFVADAANRVVVFFPPFLSGVPAIRLMGVVPPTAQIPNPTVSANSLGVGNVPPTAIFFIGTNPYVVDAGANRILSYDPYDQWPSEGTSFSPPAKTVLGQPDFASFKANSGKTEPTAGTLSFPAGALFQNGEMYVADSGNNRVLDFPQTSGAFANAARVLGQTDFPFNSLNLIEGREFMFYLGLSNDGLPFPGGAMVVDAQSNPPHLYVADAGNNRILGFRDVRSAKAGQKADIVIGQPDLFRSLINYPTNDVNQWNPIGLFQPQGLALDPGGNLWVCDSGNGRVLRFPLPFDQTTGQNANLVLGQLNFGSKIADPSPQTMARPYGIAISTKGDVAVSDAGYNRVLIFAKPSAGDFTNGQVAVSVLGQPDFVSVAPRASASNGFRGPRLMAVDAGDQLYVADPGNGRVAIFRNISGIPVGAAPSLSIPGLNNPIGVAVSPNSGEIWVANTFSNAVVRYPNFNQLLLNPAPLGTFVVDAPLAVAFDGFGNPIVAEGANRVSFYFPQVAATNAANFFPRYAPGMLASLFGSFGASVTPTNATTLPIPTTLVDTQVFVDGVASPVLYAGPTQVNFQIPIDTREAIVEIQAVRASTGQVLASGFFQIEQSSPGMFTLEGHQIAAVNDDNTLNGAAHPAKAGHFISLYATGQGFVAGAPADGNAPTGAVPTDQHPSVYMGGTTFIPDGDVQYSGLAPGFVGLWQINAKVPTTAAPGNVPVFIQFKGNNSQTDALGNRVSATIVVSQ